MVRSPSLVLVFVGMDGPLLLWGVAETEAVGTPSGFREAESEPLRVLMLLNAGFDPLTVGAFCSALSAGELHLRYRILFASPHGGLLEGAGGLRIATRSPAELESERPDILLVVGGAASESHQDSPVQDWLRRVRERCCRVYALGCGNDLAIDTVENRGLGGRERELGWDAPVASRFDRVWTSPGAGAAIDVALLIVEEDHGAPSAWAAASALRMPSRRAADDPSVGTILRLQARSSRRFAELMAIVRKNPAMRADVESLAELCGMSLRTFTRRFQFETGTTPAAAVEAIRVEFATALRSAGDLTMKEIAHRSGFRSEARLRSALNRRDVGRGIASGEQGPAKPAPRTLRR